METLLKLSKVRSMGDISGLRKLSNDIENCVRNLRSMDVETSTYGSLLIPLLKERLPDELVFNISRRFEDRIWTLDLLIEYTNKEIKASENCSSFFKSSSSQPDRSTAYNLGISAENDRQCVFCSNSHPSYKCRKVTNVKSRVEILKRSRKCFLCLGSGHQKRDCKANYVCKNCNGRHHITICYGKEEKEPERKENEDKQIEIPQNLVMSARAQHDAILLQTATAHVQDGLEKHRATTKILFDSGSQRSFIREDLRDKLNLKRIRTENVVIKTFGEGDSNTVSKTLDVVKVKVKHRRKNLFSFVEALCVPKICGSVSKKLDLSKYPHLRGLELADFYNSVSFDEPIGVLVGIDFYHDFFLGKS